jgi:hypothetical protein
MLEHDRRQRRQGDIDAVGTAVRFLRLSLYRAQVSVVSAAVDLGIRVEQFEIRCPCRYAETIVFA